MRISTLDRRRLAAVSAALAAALALTACSGAEPEDDDKSQEITMLYAEDITGLDVHDATGFTSGMMLGMHVFDTLVQLETDGYQPRLAESWEFNDDGTTLTFKLRDDVVFHDGTPMTAELVAESFQRMLDNPELAQATKMLTVNKITAVDEYTVEFAGDEPIGPAFLASLAHPSFGSVMLPSAPDGDTTIGTGPFRFVEWEPEERLVYETNEDYWMDPPDVSGLVIEIVPEGATRAFRLENGEADIVYDIPGADVERLEQNADITINEGQSGSWRYIGFHLTSREEFQDKRVRQALNYAVDKEAILESVLFGIGDVLDAPVGPAMYLHTSIGEYSFDPSRAKDLLAEAGYPDGFSMTLLADNRDGYPQIATAVADYWKAVGVEVQVRTLEYGVLLEELAKPAAERQGDAYLSSYGAADPDGIRVLLHSEEWPPRRNYGEYKNSEVDRLLELAAQELDEGERQEHYARAFEVIMADAPWVFLDDLVRANGWRSNIEGVEVHESNQRLVDLRGVTIAE